MNHQRIVVALIITLVVLGVAVAGWNERDDSTQRPESEYDHASDDAPFAFTIERVDDCGAACREVTATVTNNQDETAHDVTVTNELYAGRNTTTDEALLWENRETVGSLDPGESYTSTVRVDLSLEAASQLSQRDRRVTIRTIVVSDERTVAFRTTRDVS